jgi:hypothetical protein
MGDSGARSSEPASGATSSGRAGWRQWSKSAALLLVAAVSLYLVLPTLLSVLGSWRSLSHLEWFFAVPVFVSEAASYGCLWQLDRIALGTRGWFAVACAQLAGNAVGRFVPGAPTPFTVEMLRRAGVDTGEAAAAFTASTSLQLATTAALPLLALPAILGGTPVSHSLVAAAYLGVGVLVVLVAAGTAAFASDRPLELAGRGIQWLLNATIRRRHPVVGLPGELLADRDFIRTTLGGRWKAAVAAAAANTGSTIWRCCSRCGRSGPTPGRHWSCSPTRPPSCWRCCRSRLAAWASSRRGWWGRSPWLACPEATPWRRRCCTGWPPTGCRFPPAAWPTCCSATATTDAMEVVEAAWLSW